jgi:hypothetical protein
MQIRLAEISNRNVVKAGETGAQRLAQRGFAGGLGSFRVKQAVDGAQA